MVRVSASYAVGRLVRVRARSHERLLKMVQTPSLLGMLALG